MALPTSAVVRIAEIALRIIVTPSFLQSAAIFVAWHEPLLTDDQPRLTRPPA
ncbi:hypothetical protein [Novosphingobium resinovorum]|uniref:hypothetical protein n=1 Tax=Novosphingobium resinovorum TaxID=158500 RepID=UPI002ED12E56|nr:hypothetical protein [Novosphingobium resinovorum]